MHSLAQAPTLDDASWIWYSLEGGAVANNFPEETDHFRAAFALPADAKIAGAEIVITADNLFSLYLNGSPVGENDEPNAWNSPHRFDVASLLKPGRNVIAVEAANTAPGAAGLLVKLIAKFADGKSFAFVSDGTWKASDSADVKWEQPDFDDATWRPAHLVGEFGIAPWGKFAVPAKVEAPGAVTATATNEAVAVGDVWPDAIAFVGGDCSLYRPRGGMPPKYDSLNVTIFNPRDSRAFPEHDLPAPMKVGHKLCVLKPARPGTKPTVMLDAGKGAIGSPSVSFDGKSILISMAKEGDSFFHIFRVPAGGGAAVQLTDGPFFDIDPVELPDGRIAFTSTRAGTFEEYHCPPSRSLFTMSADGRNIRPLTSTFIFDNEPEVLADGRILFIRSDNFFDRGKVETLLHAIHPDGTEGYTEFGLDLGPEYGGRLRANNVGSPAPMPDGRVAYVTGGDITLGHPGSPSSALQHLRVEAGDVAALPDGRLLCTVARRIAPIVAAKKGKKNAGQFSYEKIAVVDPAAKDARPKTIFESEDGPLHSPVYLGPRIRPPVMADKLDAKKLGDVHATGILFCQDARLTKNTTAGWPNVRAIRVLAGHGLTMRSSHSYIVHAGNDVTELGAVPLAPDGSFAVEVPADTAIAFQAVDAEGRSELNEMSWIYVRPGEKRGCVGCHQPRQSSPPCQSAVMLAMQTTPLKLLGQGQPHRFRGNNAAVTGLMEMQFDRYREVAGLNRHADPNASGADEVASLIKQLKGTDASLKISSAQRLAVFRDAAASPALVANLRDPSREVRVATAMALAACGTRDSVPALLESLGDADPLVAQASSIALENLTGHSEPFSAFVSNTQPEHWRNWFKQTTWKAIQADLMARLKDSNRDVVRRAAVALGHIGDSETTSALDAFVKVDREINPYPEWRKTHQGDGARFNAASPANPRTLQAAVRSLGYLKDANAIPMLADTIEKNHNPGNGNLFLAESAAEALGLIATPAAESALIAAFAKLGEYPHYSGWYGDHSALIACHASPVHYFIAESLDRIASTNAAAIIPNLIRSVPTDFDRALFPANDDYETVIGRVIRRNDPSASVVETCLAILGDPAAAKTKTVADAIATTHGAWGGKPDAENRAAQILSLACRDGRYEPRIRAAFDRYRALTNDIPRDFGTGIPVVNKLPVKHWVCFFLARSLGNIANAESVPSLLAALASPTEAAIGRPDPLGPEHLFLHNDLTPCWRAEAAWALGRIGDRRAAPALLAVVANFDNAPDTRAEAIKAIGALHDADAIASLGKLAADYPETSGRRAMLEICGAPAR